MRDIWNEEVIADIADLLIYQSVMVPRKPSNKIVAGVEYIMIDPAYADLTPDFRGPIVVSMGGSDPHNLTGQVVSALIGVDRKIIVINGNAATPVDDVDVVEIVHSPTSLTLYLSGASLLIGALGMTAYEASAAGVPSILTAWSDDHLATAQELEQRGVCTSIGTWEDFDGDDLRALVDDLLTNRAAWQQMSEAGKALVDGQGVKRVAGRIAELTKFKIIIPDAMLRVSYDLYPEMGNKSSAGWSTGAMKAEED